MGINCGHEEVFNGWSDGYGFRDVWWDRLLDGGFDGDSSLNCTPFFDVLKDKGIICLHQIRNRDDCVASLIRNKHFHYDRGLEKFIYHNCPGVDTDDQWSRKCYRYYDEWNDMGVMKSDLAWNVEDIDVRLVEKILYIIEADIDRHVIDRAIMATRTDVNTTK